MKSLIFKNKVIVVFDDGTTKTIENSSEEILDIIERDDEQALIEKLNIETPVNIEEIKQEIINSSILEKRGNMTIMPSVSDLSLPLDLVQKILELESNSSEEVNKYINFWRLISLNPDSRVRDNIFWFIRRWNMQISPAGFIICYRNVNLKKEGSVTSEMYENLIEEYYMKKYMYGLDPSLIESPIKGYKNLEEAYQKVINEQKGASVYTDAHTRTFEIKIGQPVRLDRSKCDAVQEHSCSSGLHVGAKGWLQQNYCGEITIQALVSPTNVVAVPTIDNYGKMRCCEYLPTGIVHFDKNGQIIEPPISIESDIDYLKHISYDGDINNDDYNQYQIFRTGTSREEIFANILANLNS